MKEFKHKIAIIILTVMLLVQYSDLQYFYGNERTGTRNISKWHSQLSSSDWSALGDRYEHIIFLSYQNFLTHESWSILDFASNNNMTVNDSYLARKDLYSIDVFKAEERARVLDSEINSETIYIISSLQERDFHAVDGLSLYLIDDIIIGLKGTFDFEDESVVFLTIP